MPKSTAFDPVITQTGGAQNVNLPPAKTTSIGIDPQISQGDGSLQTVDLPVAK
jgi:hypothetical protein